MKVCLEPAFLFVARPRVLSRRKDGVPVYGIPLPARIANAIGKDCVEKDCYVAIAPMAEGTLSVNTGVPESRANIDSVLKTVGELFAELQEELAGALDSDAYHRAIDIVEKYFNAIEDELRELKGDGR